MNSSKRSIMDLRSLGTSDTKYNRADYRNGVFSLFLAKVFQDRIDLNETRKQISHDTKCALNPKKYLVVADAQGYRHGPGVLLCCEVYARLEDRPSEDKILKIIDSIHTPVYEDT